MWEILNASSYFASFILFFFCYFQAVMKVYDRNLSGIAFLFTGVICCAAQFKCLTGY